MEDKIAVLLADSDALRRDGMAAVVQGTGGYNVVGHCADGASAIEKIRALEPDVAIIDLNLPKLHGIEVVRLVRGESLRTKIIVVSGTDDDDIIREVVRAGGDGYLLKNGPARHLLDAINYVRDGGQYFSPHLRRDGLDRELLQERPQALRDPAVQSRAGDGHSDSARPGTQSRALGVREPIRERLRERIEADRNEHLEDRDYEILSMMAEGIRPILDRLDDIEGRVNGMETGLEPVPRDPGGWLSTQFADTLRGSGRNVEVAQVGRSVRELEARLPKLIEQTVSQRFHTMADRLQREIEETHIKTLETFVKNIQIKLVNRVSALEKDMAVHAENMNQLRESSQRTEDNLSRLISGVDKLAQELPRRLQEARGAAAESGEARAKDLSPGTRPAGTDRKGADPNSQRSTRPSGKGKRIDARIRAFWVAVALILSVAGIWEGTNLLAKRTATSSAASDTKTQETAPFSMPGANADTKTKLDAAGEFVRRKDYPSAEELYRQVTKSDPKNVDALKGLASVLYRQDKIEESAAILDRIPAQ